MPASSIKFFLLIIVLFGAIGGYYYVTTSPPAPPKKAASGQQPSAQAPVTAPGAVNVSNVRIERAGGELRVTGLAKDLVDVSQTSLVLSSASYMFARAEVKGYAAELLVEPRRLLSGALEIDVTSLRTGDIILDQRLNGTTVFDGARYPKVKLVMKKVEVGQDGSVTMLTDVTIRGLTKPARMSLGREGRIIHATLPLDLRDFQIRNSELSVESVNEMTIRFSLGLWETS